MDERRDPDSLPARSYHHGDLRRALLEVGARSLACVGPHALSLREVSRSAGVSHSAAYRHFPSKADLLAALAERGFRQLTADMRRAAPVPGHRPGAARLIAAGQAYVAFGVAHAELLQLMFGGQIGRPGEHPPLDDAAMAAYAVLRGAIEDGQRGGEFRRGDAAMLALAAWSLVHGLALLYAGQRVGLPGATVPPPEQVSAALSGLLLGGIEARDP
ncbi:MAG: TetR/AcrR family transcriptional regulator [Lautropia sp.]